MIRLRPLPTGLGAGLLLAALIAPAASAALRELAAARDARAQLAAAAAPDTPPPLLVAPRHGWRADSAATAQRAIAARVRNAATRDGILVEALAPAPAPAGLAAVRIRLSGAEKSVIALADALERDPPLLRLRRWRIVPLDQGEGVRLTGEAIAPWQ